jgi:hypothetical protein
VKDLVLTPISDTTTLLIIILLLLYFLLLQQRRRPWWYAGLFGILLWASLVRENGFVLAPTIIVVALYQFFSKQIDRRQAFLTIGMALLAILVYFLMRGYATTMRSAVGLPDQRTGFLGGVYETEEIAGLSMSQRWGVYLYTIAAHIIGAFFPIFGGEGAINPLYIAGIMGLAVVAGGTWWLFQKWLSWPSRSRRVAGVVVATGAIVGIVVLGALTIQSARLTLDHLRLASRLLSYASYGVITLGVLLLLYRNWPRLSGQDKMIVVFAFVSTAALGAISFYHFRYRDLRYGLVSWLMAMTVALKNRDNTQPIDRHCFLEVLILLMGIIQQPLIDGWPANF